MQAILTAMGRDPDIHIHGFLSTISLGKVICYAGISGVDYKLFAGVNRAHVGDDHLVVAAIFPHFHGVTRTTFRVARMFVHHQGDIPNLDYLAIGNDLVDVYRFKRNAATEVGIAEATVFKHPGIICRGPHFGPGNLLYLGKRGGVVPVRLHGKQYLYILHLETDSGNVIANRCGRFCQPGVNENMSFIGGNQEDAEVIGAYSIKIADHPVTGKRSRPPIRLGIELSGGDEQKTAGDC